MRSSILAQEFRVLVIKSSATCTELTDAFWAVGWADSRHCSRGLCTYGLLQLPADCSQGQQQKWDTELRKGNKSKGENRLSCMKAVVINKHTSGTTAITTLKTRGMTDVSPCGTHAAIAQGVLSCWNLPCILLVCLRISNAKIKSSQIFYLLVP